MRRVPKVFIDQPDAELPVSLDYLVAHRMMVGDPELFVVQVGAFDGVTGDPVHPWIKRFGWRGVLAEPQSRYFVKLQRAYADCPGIVLRNVAVADRTGRRTFFHVSEHARGVPEWVGQLASFDRSTILAHCELVPGLENLIESSEVDCVTFEDLLADVDCVDLLQIDAEGYDGKIVRMFDFDRWRPSIVSFESVHLPPGEHESVMRHLISHGYRIARAGVDTIGYAPP